MRQPPRSIALVACLCLLGLQLTGLHLHANAEGFDPVLHGTHVHGVAHRHDLDAAGDAASPDAADDHHDHDGDRDVAAVELCTGLAKAKIPAVLIGNVLAIVAGAPAVSTVGGDEITRPPTGHIRWRPPLRGPPRISA